MLDIISMTTLLMITFILGLITFLILCIIVGGNSNKTEYERKMEDEEQMKYLEIIKISKLKIGRSDLSIFLEGFKNE